MYKKSKRFLAGFLALLLVVTMIPTDLLGVVYAAEETDAIVSEAFDSVDDAEEAEVLENADADADAEEALDENDIVKIGESVESSEPETPEGGNSSEAPAPSQPESTPESSQPESTPQPSQPESTEPESSEPESTPSQPTEPVEDKSWELNISDFEVGATSIKKGIFEVSGKIAVTKNEKKYVQEDGTSITFTNRLSMEKDSGTTIKFTPEKAGMFKMYAVTGSSGKDRELQLSGGSTTVTFKTNTGGTMPEGSNVRCFQQRVEASIEYSLVNIAPKAEGGINLYYVAVEYDEDPVDLSQATVSVKVTDKDGKEVASPKYTGDAYSIKTTVTDKDGKEVKSKRYKVTYERKGTGENWSATDDLTSAGTIRVKVENAEGNNLTGSKVSDDIVIAVADLEIGDRTINHSPDEEGSKEFDIAALFAETAGADTLSFALDSSIDGYNLGNVIENPVITDGKLTYSVVSSKPQTITPAVIGVKVTSNNYNDKTFKITINVKEKTPVTIKLESKTHVYNKEAYGFGDNVVITEVTGDGISDTNKEEAIADLKDNLSYKYQVDGGEVLSEEPVDAGVYTVTAELASASAYTLSSSATDATLTISPKPVKMKAKDVTWDKALDAHPVSKQAEAKDYEFIAVTEGEENFGLVTGDTMTTQPTIKYCKTGTTDELADADWSALVNDATVDITLSGADAGANYTIAYEKGTLTTLIRTAVTSMTAVPDTGATLTPANITAGSYTTNAFSTDNIFVFTADETNTVTVEASRLKSDGLGSPFYRSVGFKVSKAANVAITCSSANGSSKRPVAVGKINSDGTITQKIIGYVKASDTLSTVLETEGVYFLYSVKGATEGTDGGINITEVKVNHNNVVIPETVSVTPAISEADLAKLNGAKVYFTATGETDAEVISGTALELVKDKEYTLVVKNADGTVSDTLTAQINGSLSYTPTENANVTIVIEDAGENPPAVDTVAVTVDFSGDALGKAKVYFVSGSDRVEATTGEVTLKKNTQYNLVVEGAPEDTTMTAEIEGSSVYTTSEAAASVTINVTSKKASNIKKPIADPVDGTEFGKDGGTVTLKVAEGTAEGAKIYYTTNGDEPTTASTLYDDTKKITVTQAMTIKAIVVVGEGANAEMSDVLTVSYTILAEGGVAKPTADPAPTEDYVAFGTKVTLKCATEGAEIYYATGWGWNDADSIVNNGTKYADPIEIQTSTTIYAVAVKTEGEGENAKKTYSAVASFTYKVDEPEEPDFPTTELRMDDKDITVTTSSLVEGGKVKIPATYVTYKDPDTKKTVKFAEGIDYTVKEKEGAANTLVLTGTGRDPYDGRDVDGYSIEKGSTREVTYTVISKANAKNKSQYIDVSKAKITLTKTEIKNLYYTGYAHEPSLDLSKAGSDIQALAKAGRLNIAYKNNIGAGKASVIISVIPEEKKADSNTPNQTKTVNAAIEFAADGNSGETGANQPSETTPAADTSKVYYGAKTLTFNIKKAALKKGNGKGATAEARVILPKNLNFEGDSIYAENISVMTKPTAAGESSVLFTRGKDYTVTYKNSRKAGKATVTIKGIGNNLSGNYALTYTIGALDLTGWKIDMTDADNKEDPDRLLKYYFVYSPKGARLTSVRISKGEGDKKEYLWLEEGLDYTAKYKYADKKDKKAGTDVTITIKGKNSCKGTLADVTFKIQKANFNSCIRLNGKKGLCEYDEGGEAYLFYVDKASKKTVLEDLKKSVIVTDNAGAKLKLDKDYIIEEVKPAADAPAGTLSSYVVKAADAVKSNYTEKSADKPDAYIGDTYSIDYVVANNLAKDKNFIMDKDLNKNDPLGYDGRNPVEITQDVLDKYINKVPAETTGEALDKAQKYQLDTNIEIVYGSYKNNAKKGTAQVTIKGTGDSDANHEAFYGTKVLKFKIVEK